MSVQKRTVRLPRGTSAPMLPFWYLGAASSGRIRAVKASVTAQWAALDHHFRREAKVVDYFRHTGADTVVWMWKIQTNEDGKRLSQFERDALIERHYELFGTWPN